MMKHDKTNPAACGTCRATRRPNGAPRPRRRRRASRALSRCRRRRTRRRCYRRWPASSLAPRANRTDTHIWGKRTLRTLHTTAQTSHVGHNKLNKLVPPQTVCSSIKIAIISNYLPFDSVLPGVGTRCFLTTPKRKSNKI